jgi:hypothetical protein
MLETKYKATTSPQPSPRVERESGSGISAINVPKGNVLIELKFNQLSTKIVTNNITV